MVATETAATRAAILVSMVAYERALGPSVPHRFMNSRSSAAAGPIRIGARRQRRDAAPNRRQTLAGTLSKMAGANQQVSAATARQEEKTEDPAPTSADGAKFVFFDLETTGLSPQGCRIIEIAALRVARGGIACNSFHSLIRIDDPLPYFITRLTGITDDMLLFDGEPIELVLPRFAKFVENLPLVSYNVSFDMSFLRVEAQRQRIRLANTPVCALQLARAKLPDLPNHKLKTVATHFGISPEQAHRALDDCEVGLRVFTELMRT
jgi:DNA polymerase III epsilon subunit family exonuclease